MIFLSGKLFMKLIHTADWHLGKIFNNISLLDQQKYCLEQLVRLIEQEKPDFVLIAGDIYDRAVPPAEAVRLLDEVLHSIVVQLKTPVLAIAGNHDSPERIGYCQSILQRQGLHIFGELKLPLEPLIHQDQWGSVYLYAFPYTDPENLAYLLQSYQPEKQHNIQTHQDVADFVVRQIAEQRQPTDRIVLVGHLFVKNGTETKDSERVLREVGGASQVAAEVFAAIDYTALGHLHRPQEFAGGKVRYSGSLMKYSFAEHDQPKSTTIVELRAKGQCQITEVPMFAQQDFRRVEGYIENATFHLAEGYQANPQDFLEVTLCNSEVVLNAMSIVQSRFPNALRLLLKYAQNPQTSTQLSANEVSNMDELKLFETFYERIHQNELPAEARTLLSNLIKKARQDQP